VTTAEHSILTAGGTGITPILSMMQSLSSKNNSFEIHYSAHRFSEFAFRERVVQVAGDSARFYTSKEAGGQRLYLKELLTTPKP
jgi:ferredoxin-NADP reductase